MLLFKGKRQKKDLSKTKYQLLLIFLWVYTLVWLVVNYYIWGFSEWELMYKILSELVLVVLVPDLDGLLMSYERYLKEQDSP